MGHRLILDNISGLDFRAKTAASIVKKLGQEAVHSAILFLVNSVRFLHY